MRSREAISTWGASAFDQENSEPCSPLSVLLRARQPCAQQARVAGDEKCRLLGRTRAEDVAGGWPQKPPAERVPLAVLDQWVDDDAGAGLTLSPPPAGPPAEESQLSGHLPPSPAAAAGVPAELEWTLELPLGPPPGLPLTPAQPTRVLRLEELLAESSRENLETPRKAQEEEALPQPGLDTLPSVGSWNHTLGNCRPCAFVFKAVSCNNGASCEFCHLCSPGERHRRKRNQKAAKRAAEALATAMASWSLPPAGLGGV